METHHENCVRDSSGARRSGANEESGRMKPRIARPPLAADTPVKAE
ncbi:MAG: hypothetical protein HDR57_02810 [Treponema sp.]|nr:hypothetical protein [Treponema sp.]